MTLWFSFRYRESVIRLAILFAVTLGYAAAQPLSFTRQVLADDLKGGYQVITCDVNNDGKPDLIALASGMTDLYWFENPKWTRHVLASNLHEMINAACWNGGDSQPPLIAVAYEFSMHPKQSKGVVALLKPGATITEPWIPTEIDRLPASHRLRWADIDGAGRKVLVNAPLANAEADAPDFRGRAPLVYYQAPQWKRELISDAEEGVMHGILVTDWDRNHRDALLIGSFLGIHLYRYGLDRKWSRTEIAQGSPAPWPKSGTSDVTTGHAHGERFIAAIEPWHGNQVAVYNWHGNNWERTVIDDTLLDAHNIAAADLDADGNDEIIAGFRGKPFGIYTYAWREDKWQRRVLEQGEVSAAGCTVADLDGDKRPDIACIGSATHNLVVYLNRR